MIKENNNLKTYAWLICGAVGISFLAPAMMCGHLNHDAGPVLFMGGAGAICLVSGARLAFSGRGFLRVFGIISSFAGLALVILVAMSILDEM